MPMHESPLGRRPTVPDQRREERASSLTHGIMALMAFASLGPLVYLAVLRGNVRHIVSFSVFGSALVFLFMASALMHRRNMQGLHKRVYDFLDYTGIYLVIAATYTPFCLVTLHGAWGWSIFGIIWSLAGGGTLLSLIFKESFDKYAVGVYLLMGWMILIPIKPLAAALPPGGLALLFGGGLAYSIGVIVLVRNRLFYAHAIWHLFVGLGALLSLRRRRRRA